MITDTFISFNHGSTCPSYTLKLLSFYFFCVVHVLYLQFLFTVDFLFLLMIYRYIVFCCGVQVLRSAVGAC
jgi:hypothetical protein